MSSRARSSALASRLQAAAPTFCVILLATRLLREGATLDTIGAVLRHRVVDTTALYAKVDVDLLRQMAQPWPAAVSPC